MGRHLVIGAGPVGSGTALRLADAGHDVALVSRGGAGPLHARVERVAADATDGEVVVGLAQGADSLYNCANPRYHRWPQDWPPIAEALLGAAEATGAVLVTMSNLYGYGRVAGAMTEDTELRPNGPKGAVRVAMWEAALAAHRAGRARVTEARASDFFGPGVTGASFMGERVVPRVLAGQDVRLVLGGPDVPHSWTYVDDVSRALVILGTDERALGRPWHVPTAPPASPREMVAALAAAAGVPTPPVTAMSPWVVRAAGFAWPTVRELQETRHQFDQPFMIDSSAFTDTFGVRATPLPDAVRATLDWWRARTSRPQVGELTVRMAA